MKLWRVLELTSKELKSTVRDRRAMFAMVVAPILLMPLFMFGIPALMSGVMRKAATEVQRVGVLGRQYAPELVEHIEESNFELKEAISIKEAIDKLKLPAVLEIPPDYGQLVGTDAPPVVKVYYKFANVRSQVVGQRLENAVSSYVKRMVRRSIRQKGLSTSILEPVEVEVCDVSTKEERRAGFLAFLFPMMIAIWTISGGMITAIDATAGEKERGTLETLLVSPITRGETLAGKFLAVLIVSMAAVVAALASLVVSAKLAASLGWGKFPGMPSEAPQMVPFDISIAPLGIVIILLCSLTLAIFLVAIELSLAIFAKSYKEAQAYLTPLTLIVVLPAVFGQMIDFMKVTTPLFAVPIFNVIVFFTEVLKGNYVWSHILTAFFSTTVYALIAVGFATLVFQREQVLFRN
jgi:sodium transport system permease protein